MEAIDTYIVRVYRRDPHEPRHLAGLVEIVGTGEKRVFADDGQLLEILMPQERHMLPPRDQRRTC